MYINQKKVTLKLDKREKLDRMLLDMISLTDKVKRGDGYMALADIFLLETALKSLKKEVLSDIS